MLLKQQHTVEIIPAAPFNFDATLHNPSHFPTADTEWQPGILWQTMVWQHRRLGLVFENRGTVDSPRIALSVWSNRALSPAFCAGLLAELDYRYALQLDLAEFNRAFADEPLLGPILEKWRGLRPSNRSSLYEYLMIAIVLQNATVRRTVQMMQALFEHYGTLCQYDGKSFYCFWEPQALAGASQEELRALKMGYRAKSILRVTEAFIEGDIDEFALRSQSHEEQRQALLQLYGVGPASVWYILSDVFHHHDELNHISPWEQKIYSKLFFGRDPDHPVPVDKLLRFFDKRYGRYKMLAVHYVWADLWWKRQNEHIDWLEELIRL